VASIEETLGRADSGASSPYFLQAGLEAAGGSDGRRRLVRQALVASDAVAFVASLVICMLASGATLHLGSAMLLLLAAPAWILLAGSSGLYARDEQHVDHTTADEVLPVFQFVTIATWLGFLFTWFVGMQPEVGGFAAFWIAALVLTLGGRVAARAYVRRQREFRQKTIIVGAGTVGQLVGRKLVQHPEFGISLLGFVDAEPKPMRTDLADLPLLGSADDVAEIVHKHDVRRVIVAFSNDSHDRQLDLIRRLRGLDVQIDVVPRLFEAVGPAVGIHTVEGMPLVGLPSVRHSQASRALKRLVDILVATISLVLLSPLFALIAWRIKSDSPGPVFFRQVRIGEQMRSFTLLKFRTMAVETDDAPHRAYMRAIMDTSEAPTNGGLYKLDRPDATTRVGRRLRRLSLDELPQLINVLRGEMSLVGPRPCLEYETEFFEPHHFTRFDVPAGVTGLWQVSARARTTFKEALELDVAYARNWSIALDLKLLARTPLAALRGGGTTA
jgi:exopolysaccharide biosynthesis polyprenyl glycosylphosphotransferase